MQTYAQMLTTYFFIFFCRLNLVSWIGNMLKLRKGGWLGLFLLITIFFITIHLQTIGTVESLEENTAKTHPRSGHMIGRAKLSVDVIGEQNNGGYPINVQESNINERTVISAQDQTELSIVGQSKLDERTPVIGEQNRTKNLIGEEKTSADERGSVIGQQQDRRILISGDYCIEYYLNGTIFSNKGKVVQSHKVKICRIKTFGKETTQEAVKDFIELSGKMTMMLKSPSLMWYNGELIVTLRLRLTKLKNANKLCWGFRCNHIYLRRFDNRFNQIGQRDIITIRTPIAERRHERTGPHEPRLIQINGSMYSVFATGTTYGWISGIWDYQKQRHFVPDFQELLIKKNGQISEKNWAPVVVKDELYFIRHLDPLQVVKCKIYEKCSFVKNATDVLAYQMDDENSPLRGGTSFELYRYPYYVGIAHGTYFAGPQQRYYKAHLIILCVEPFKIVYVSDPLEVQPELYKQFLGEKVWKVVMGHFIFPTGLMVESEDSLVIGAHINDIAAILLRLEGVKSLVDSVIREVDGTTVLSPNPELSIQKYLQNRAQVLNITGTSH